MKVYIINSILLTEEDASIDITKVDDEKFKEIVFRSGFVYSLRGFENAYNQDDFDFMNTYIRFIKD